MRILFVGDYDLAGEAIATRLYREGNRICWLTQEKQKKLWSSRIAGRVFRRDISYRTCRQIMQGESIDCVVILTAPWREKYLETESEEHPSLLSLMDPVLRATSSVKVKHICLFSSVDLRQEKLLSPILEELRAGERVLRSFCQEKKLPALVLRIGCLFGETIPEDAGFAGQVLATMLRGVKITCPFGANATFDFLCDSDLADAVYRLLNINKTGICTIATGRPVTAETIYTTAAEVAGYQGKIEYGEQTHSCEGIPSQEVRNLCGWMPFYLFDEKGLLFLAQCRRAGEAVQRVADREGKSRRLNRSLVVETAQNLLLFAIAMLLTSYTTSWTDLRYVDVRLLYVIIIAISFGMRQGILATILAIISYIVSLVRSQIDISYIFYSIESWIPFIVYGVAGAFAGYWSDKKNDEYDGLLGEYQEQGDRYTFLKGLYREVVEIKNNLQKQIVISRDSLGHLYSITEELNSLSPRIICLRTIRVVEEIMECQSAALYLKPQKESSYGRLMASSANLSAQLTPSIDFKKYPKLWEAMENKTMYVNTELDSSYPALAMPVSDGEGSVAMVMLAEIAPSGYTVYYRNLFQTLVQMIQENLTRAFQYQEENRDKIYLPGTSVLTGEAFENERTSLQKAQEEYDYPLSEARVVAQAPMDLQTLARRAASLLRGTDLLGIGQDGALWAVFLYVNQETRAILEKRFANHGITLEWIE